MWSVLQGTPQAGTAPLQGHRQSSEHTHASHRDAAGQPRPLTADGWRLARAGGDLDGPPLRQSGVHEPLLQPLRQGAAERVGTCARIGIRQGKQVNVTAQPCLQPRSGCCLLHAEECRLGCPKGPPAAPVCFHRRLLRSQRRRHTSIRTRCSRSLTPTAVPRDAHPRPPFLVEFRHPPLRPFAPNRVHGTPL